MTDFPVSEEQSGCPYKADGLDNCDAVVWARKFCETAEALGHAGLDEAWVAGWFANAMGAVEWYHPEIKRLKANQRTARDAENERLRQTWEPCKHFISHREVCSRCREMDAIRGKP